MSADTFPAEEALRARLAALESLVRDHDLAPIPPVELRVRVGGWDDPDHFLGVGRKIFWDLKRLLGMAGRKLDGFSGVLDFGCGCGRTLRFFPPSAQRLTGCDIDQESIAWCQANLGHLASFVRTDAMPPLPFATGQFDFAYLISVFTHLPEDMQFAWLDELARIVRPGGMVIASAHGPGLLAPEIALPLRESLAREGFLYLQTGTTSGLPDFYQTAYHSEQYVRERWTRHFRIAASLPRGINNHQDAYVLERLA